LIKSIFNATNGIANARRVSEIGNRPVRDGHVERPDTFKQPTPDTEVKNVRLIDLLNAGEKKMIQNLFSMEDSEDNIGRGTGSGNTKSFEQYVKNNLTDTQPKINGTIIDIEA
jgi:hypothetical protein